MQKAIHGITVAHFYETYREKLRMELVTGEAGLHRLIREGSINRPALALTGFFKYFANKRIQVLGRGGDDVPEDPLAGGPDGDLPGDGEAGRPLPRPHPELQPDQPMLAVAARR